MIQLGEIYTPPNMEKILELKQKFCSAEELTPEDIGWLLMKSHTMCAELMRLHVNGIAVRWD